MILTYGDLVYDDEARMLGVRGGARRPIELSGQRGCMLAALMAAQGAALSKERLSVAIYGDAPPVSHVKMVASLAFKLRASFRDLGSQMRVEGGIRTGWRLVELARVARPNPLTNSTFAQAVAS